MIVLETPSPVVPAHGATRQQSLAPLVLESEILGKGAFGTVFGPYSAAKTREILATLYRRPVGECTVLKEYVFPDNASTYILKVEFGNRTAKPCASTQRLADALERLPLPFHRCFLLPLVCGRFTWGRYEIQRYGGVELYSLLKQNDDPWGPEKRFPVFFSMLRILRACLLLIDKADILLTDIKPANMVFDRGTGEISLIDLEFVPLDPKKIKSMTFTLYPEYIPIQFINSAFFTNAKDRLSFVQKLSSLSKTDQKKNVLAKNPDKETLKKVARFTVVWVVVHTLNRIVKKKFKSDTGLYQEMNAMVAALKDGDRWRGSMDVVEKKLEALTFKKTSLKE